MRSINQPKHEGSVSRGRRLWLLRIALLTLSPVLFFGLLEGGLRLGGYGYSTGFFIGPDARGMWAANSHFGRRFFPRPLVRDPYPCALSPKPAGTVRIFVLGGSAAYGTPDPAFSVSRILQVMLREKYPSVRFEVVNAAMTAINSHVALEVARDCAAHEPDLFVVYMGNNEVIGPFGPGTIFRRWSPYLGVLRTGVWLRSARIGQLLDDMAGLFRAGKEAPERWRGMAMFLDNPVASDDHRLAVVYDHYERNLTDICGVARRSGAGVILSTVAVNLADCPPFASQHQNDLSPAAMAECKVLFEAGDRLQAAESWEEAEQKYKAAALIDDKFAEVHFRLGQCLLAMGRVEEARGRFESARDLDVLRFRADSRINAAIRAVADAQSDSGVRLVDTAKEWEKSVSQDDRFYEHVHLTFRGNYQLARLILDEVCEALPQQLSLSGQGAIPSAQRCAELVALTSWDEALLADSMVDLTSRPPFTNQLNHEGRQATARKRRNRLRRQATAPESRAAAWRTYQVALQNAPDDWVLHQHLGKMARQQGRLDVAATHLRRAAELVPTTARVLADLGAVLVASGQVNAGLGYFEKALAINSDDAFTHAGLGTALINCGRIDDAVVSFQKALEIDSDCEPAHLNCALIYRSTGKMTNSIWHFSEALRIKQGRAQTWNDRGVTYMQMKLESEAEADFEKAIDTDASFHKPYCNLGAIRQGRGDYTGAILWYSRAIEQNPKYAVAYFNRARAHKALGATNNAISDFEAVLSHDRTRDPRRRNYAQAMLSKLRTPVMQSD